MSHEMPMVVAAGLMGLGVWMYGENWKGEQIKELEDAYSQKEAEVIEMEKRVPYEESTASQQEKKAYEIYRAAMAKYHSDEGKERS